MRFSLDTDASPEQVRAAMTDFSPRRLEIWSRTLDPATYDVRERGDTWAVAMESTPRSPYWVVARYDWSDPSVVRFVTVDCNYGGGGSGSVRATPRPGGGSHVEVEWSYTDVRGRKDRVVLAVIQAWPMRSVIRSGYRKALDRYAATG